MVYILWSSILVASCVSCEFGGLRGATLETEGTMGRALKTMRMSRKARCKPVHFP